MDVWYNNLATLPLGKCNAHKSQLETTIVTLKRLYPQRIRQIERAVDDKLYSLFAEGDNE